MTQFETMYIKINVLSKIGEMEIDLLQSREVKQSCSLSPTPFHIYFLLNSPNHWNKYPCLFDNEIKCHRCHDPLLTKRFKLD